MFRLLADFCSDKHWIGFKTEISMSGFPHFIFILAGLWAIDVGYAQTVPANGKGTSDKSISIDFTAVAWEHALDDIRMPKASKPIDLKIPAFAQSEMYRYSGLTPIIFERNDTEYAKAHPDYKPVVQAVEVPSEWKQVIFLVLPTVDGGFTVKPVQDDHEAFKFGSVRIINVSQEKVAIKTRVEVKVLTPQEQGVFAIPNGDTQIEFVYAQLDGVEWKLKGSAAFQVMPTDRCTVFITRTNADYFKEDSRRIDEKGNSIDYKMQARPFQLFTITERAKSKD